MLRGERKGPPEDPRDFDPDDHEFPEDPELNPGLEYKLDVVIKYLDDILDTLIAGFGCLIPLMLGVLALLGLIAGLLSAIHALLTWIFAYIAFWTVQLLVKRIIHGRPLRPPMWVVPIIWFLVGGAFLLIFFGVPYVFGWWVPGGAVAPTPTPTSTPTPVALAPTATPTRPLAVATATATPVPRITSGLDSTDDPQRCDNGEPEDGLPAAFGTIDLVDARVERVQRNGECFYKFTLTLAREVSAASEFWGGVEFDDPERGALAEADPFWLFNNTGNMSFNFHWNRGGVETMVSAIENGAWNQTSVPGYEVQVEGNRIMLYIPCEAVSQEAKWFATTTTADFSVCEQVGLEERRATLDLPQG